MKRRGAKEKKKCLPKFLWRVQKDYSRGKGIEIVLKARLMEWKNP